MAYPKYYAWVKAGTTPLPKEGAVRVAAIDQTSFEVTNFVSAEEIRKDPGSIESVFPKLLCPAIRRKAGVPGV